MAISLGVQKVREKIGKNWIAGDTVSDLLPVNRVAGFLRVIIKHGNLCIYRTLDSDDHYL